MDSEIQDDAMIGVNKVEGARVFDRTGEEIGTIHEVMIDKLTGNVAYVIMAFGGVLGMAEKYAPVPWTALRYDVRKRGYTTDYLKDTLIEAPLYDDTVPWSRDYDDRVRQHFNAPDR